MDFANRVLVLEDDWERIKWFRSMLVGFVVDYTDSAQTAIELLKINKYNYIYLDHDLFLNESWKPIKGYEGIYEVSDYGNVKRVLRRKGTVVGTMNLFYSTRNQVVSITLRNLGKDKTFSVHRLVAEAFLENPYNKSQVNHKDGNRWNNNVANLEWATSSENVQHAHDFLERKYSSYAENHKNSKSISQYDLQGNLINVYGSVHEASRQLGIQMTNIAKVARKERSSAGGYNWRYENLNPTVDSIIQKTQEPLIKAFKLENTGYATASFLGNNPHLSAEATIVIHSLNPSGSSRMVSALRTRRKVHKIPFLKLKQLNER